jgi:hypothetical protein
MTHSRDQSAPCRVTRHNNRAILTPAEETCPSRDEQPRGLLRRAVALSAVFHQHRADLLLEELNRCRIGCRFNGHSR